MIVYTYSVIIVHVREFDDALQIFCEYIRRHQCKIGSVCTTDMHGYPRQRCMHTNADGIHP